MAGQHNSRSRKSSNKVARPMAEAFRAAYSSLDLVTSMARSRRGPAIIYLSTESEQSEVEDSTATDRTKSASYNLDSASHLHESYKKSPAKRHRLTIQDSDDKGQTMSALRNYTMAYNINRCEITLGLERKKTQENLCLRDQDNESERNSEENLTDDDEDLEDQHEDLKNDDNHLDIDLKGWNMQSKHYSRTRSTANNATDEALHAQQSTPLIRISSRTAQNQSSRRYAQSMHTYKNASNSTNLLSSRPIYTTLQTSSKRQVKAYLISFFLHYKV
ncbi:hypothetical protein BDU57DRAFT_531993 [Ampelomyces quisqualis]|uniref:Uncharacterized protein n=1 Tax=Ampelomyces quisqualis TaxID=50730 RepID=A0A6A5QB50_AMPQU|nr:hypothetical protein BDU57DRAFT_531993 [Ampelomyces quisqualis]